MQYVHSDGSVDVSPGAELYDRVFLARVLEPGDEAAGRWLREAGVREVAGRLRGKGRRFGALIVWELQNRTAERRGRKGYAEDAEKTMKKIFFGCPSASSAIPLRPLRSAVWSFSMPLAC